MSIVDIEPLIALSVTANRSDATRLMRRTRPIETWLMRTAVVKLRFINLSGYLRKINKTQRIDRKSVEQGKSVSVSVEISGRRIIKQTHAEVYRSSIHNNRKIINTTNQPNIQTIQIRTQR